MYNLIFLGIGQIGKFPMASEKFAEIGNGKSETGGYASLPQG